MKQTLQQCILLALESITEFIEVSDYVINSSNKEIKTLNLTRHHTFTSTTNQDQMPDNTFPHSNPNILSKPFASTRSCQNLLCLTKRCYQQQTKQKQKILNSQYFEKLSLKQFNGNNPSVLHNQSFYDKEKGTMKRDRSTEDSEFRNLLINSGEQQMGKFIVNKHGNFNHEKTHSASFYNQFSNQPTHRIQRSSSFHQLQHPPQLKTSILQLNHSLQQQVDNDYKKISDLARLRNRLQKEIQQLDHNIDQYYGVYQTKLDQLKKIQSRIKAVEKGGKVEERQMDRDREKLLRKVPSSDQLGGRFMKKPYVQKVEQGGQIIRTESFGEHTARRLTGSGMSSAIYMKTEQKTYTAKNSCSFFKKTN